MTTFAPDGTTPAQITTRFFHLEKLALARRAKLGRGDFDTVTSRLTALAVDELSALRDGFADALSGAVTSLLDEEDLRHSVERVPFRSGDTVVCVGDSITDDDLSWANQLALLLERARPELDVRVLNFGYTGDTTQEVISRYDTVLAENPDWIIQMLGTNDARLHTSLRIATTSLAETARNLGVLKRLATEVAGARYIPMTPPPAVSRSAEEWEPFRLESISWRSEDVRAIADLVAQNGDYVDIHAAFIAANDPSLLLPDGIHPSVAGQSLIVRALLDRLATLGDPTHTTTETSPHLDTTERSTQ